jgi:hypothetical protein
VEEITMFNFRVTILVVALALTVSTGNAQFGVCDRAANDASNLINNDANIRINGIMNSGWPPDVQNAQITIINYTRGEALNNIYASHDECMRGYRQPQSIVDTAMNIYTFGLSSRLGGAAHVDTSEILNGTPLGGPNAVIPQVREQILNHDNGTGANIVRDPIGCLTFAHKC